MSITDELRREVADYPFRDNRDFALFEAIADRIDAEHEKAMNNAGQLLADAESDRNCYYLNWQDCKQKLLQRSITADELDAKIECLEDELSHSIELPKDADSEYIHMGDVMESRAGFDLFPQFEVRAMRYDGDGWEVIDRLGDRYGPSGLRHCHAPTVEDVMVEFATDWESAQDGEEKTAVLNEYAAKLQLREEA